MNQLLYGVFVTIAFALLAVLSLVFIDNPNFTKLFKAFDKTYYG